MFEAGIYSEKGRVTYLLYFPISQIDGWGDANGDVRVLVLYWEERIPFLPATCCEDLQNLCLSVVFVTGVF